MSNYENLSETMKALHFVNELLICKNCVEICGTDGDLGNKSKVNRTCSLKTCDNPIAKPTSPRPLPDNNYAYARLSTFTKETKHINSRKSNVFNRISSRSRCITRHLVHVNTRDREPSRIPMKKLVHSMSKNKKRRHKIKSFIKRLIPKSSALHNLLSTRYRKSVSEKFANILWQLCKLCRTSKMQKSIKRENLNIANMRTGSTLRTLQSISDNFSL